ncbi:GNAT family N-acetyltransferase [Streptomyces sp. NBC_01803]|uniref:GNAT family N-acetyltransferase n=1 Tax=Streptomyces sp. NBC_01803 TaxID=2975946 RepID=UPI002DDBA7DD|nr:GNAT family N-acetyltransferase [Streptomyces sp. NBC_01803]WSA44196.1 GNAT family N-acetyltransferase [Streptomyces sp. NBC_01803]
MPAEILTLSTYLPNHLPDIKQTLLDVYAEVWAQEAAEDPFFSLPRFEERLLGHATEGEWRCVIGEIGQQVVGYAYGRRDNLQEWESVLHPISQDVADYGRQGTWGLCEIMVRSPWRGQGIGYAIHRELTRQQKGPRTSLLVDSRRSDTRAVYERWGYRKVGQMQPGPDSPLYDAMVLELPEACP